MGTLITRKDGVEKNYLLNLSINPKITEELINDILDVHEVDDWEVVDGFILD